MAGGNAWFGISAGSLVMIFTYTYNLTMRLNYVSSMMQRINRALGDAAEMTRVLDEPRLVADDENAPELKVTEGAIDFEHLSFAYRDAAAGENVFDDLTLHVAAGQRVGLVGKSGSGKSTLTKLLLRLDDVQGVKSLQLLSILPAMMNPHPMHIFLIQLLNFLFAMMLICFMKK